MTIGLQLVEMPKGKTREDQRSGARFMLIDAHEQC